MWGEEKIEKRVQKGSGRNTLGACLLLSSHSPQVESSCDRRWLFSARNHVLGIPRRLELGSNIPFVIGAKLVHVSLSKICTFNWLIHNVKRRD